MDLLHVTLGSTQNWYKVGEFDSLQNGGRLHTSIEGRFVTIFKSKGELSCIDSVCYHAAGPLTNGTLKDIEDLDMTVVSCPWHSYMVGIKDGIRAYQGVDFVDGKPVPSGWKRGKVVQRVHLVKEDREHGLQVALQVSSDACPSDDDSCNTHCGEQFSLSSFDPIRVHL
jgi:nitrite reductase/ring-hydroxylating ferredoxin subunit